MYENKSIILTVDYHLKNLEGAAGILSRSAVGDSPAAPLGRRTQSPFRGRRFACPRRNAAGPSGQKQHSLQVGHCFLRQSVVAISWHPIRGPCGRGKQGTLNARYTCMP